MNQTASYCNEDALPLDSYLPDFHEFLRAFPQLSNPEANGTVTVSVSFLRFLISELAARIPFDDAFYGSTYPDVADAVRRGQIPSLHDHFCSTGFFEGRKPGLRHVDRAWYLRQYEDLNRAFSTGALADAAKHFNETGQFEDRVGSRYQYEEREKWRSRLRVAKG